MSDRSETIISQLRDLYSQYTDGEFSLRLRSPDPKATDVIQGEVLHGDEHVGAFTRRVIDNGKDPLHVIHEALDLFDDYQGQGFATRFVEWSEDRYREFGITYVKVNAQKVGSYVWAGRGYDFDLTFRDYEARASRLKLTSERQRRGAAVLVLMDQPGRLISRSSWNGEMRQDNAEEVLERIDESGAAGRRAVSAFRARLPSPADVRDDRLDGKFASPGDIAAFDRLPEAEGIDVARQVLCATGWDGRKDLT